MEFYCSGPFNLNGGSYIYDRNEIVSHFKGGPSTVFPVSSLAKASLTNSALWKP